ncbi:ABC transporter permease [Nocardiopsis sp. CC223A]|uniref:ABC transporter permease n=1 Tax=Nocardiopsis sp. CC223A TaxID=3044051 RepID=UPI00278C39BC|nr:ABC transporter permease [Nocardiopsis sp. CC223A]
MLRSLVAGILLAFAGSRANIARTILSCAGIVVGVGSLIAVVTAGDFGQRFATAYSEANAGRAATLMVGMWDTDVTDVAAFEEDLVRAGGVDVSLNTMLHGVSVRSGDQTIPDVEIRAVDATLGDIRRMTMTQGRWFTDADSESLAPVLVVNESLAGDMEDITRVQIGTDHWMDVRVVGVSSSSALDSGWYTAYLLRAPATEELIYGEAVETSQDGAAAPVTIKDPEYSVRIDPADPAATDPWGEVFTERILSASERWGGQDQESVMVYRADYAEEVNRVIGYLSVGLIGIAAITLTTGLLGVLNVGLVTVRERRRELATYRALGATRFTLFVAVVMEAVVVSLVAGVIALLGCWAVVAAGAAIVPSFIDLPPDVPIAIPPTAVLVGLGSAAGVGLLAGVIPALRALRSSVVAGLRE